MESKKKTSATTGKRTDRYKEPTNACRGGAVGPSDIGGERRSSAETERLKGETGRNPFFRFRGLKVMKVSGITYLRPVRSDTKKIVARGSVREVPKDSGNRRRDSHTSRACRRHRWGIGDPSVPGVTFRFLKEGEDDVTLVV